MWFQFTHPGGVRHKICQVCESEYEFQFTHPGGVRLDSIFSVRFDGTVSIHAPGRGATSHIMSIVASFTFQFTHPGGVRLLSTPRNTLELLFQFTHPGGVRPRVLWR